MRNSKFTGFYDCKKRPIYIGDKVKEWCNGFEGTVGWDKEKGTYKIIELGEGYEIENSHIEWEVLDKEEVHKAKQIRPIEEDYTRSFILTCVDETDFWKKTFVDIELLVNEDMEYEQVLEAIRLSSVDYCRTDIGKKVFEHNCEQFNYLDFEFYVDNTFCMKYGIKKTKLNIENIEVDANTTLVFEEDIDES